MRITESSVTALLVALVDKLCQSGFPDKVAKPCDCIWIWTLDVNDTTKEFVVGIQFPDQACYQILVVDVSNETIVHHQ